MSLFVRRLFEEDDRTHETIPLAFRKTHDLKALGDDYILLGASRKDTALEIPLADEDDSFGHLINGAYCWSEALSTAGEPWHQIRSLGLLACSIEEIMQYTRQNKHLEIALIDLRPPIANPVAA